MAKAKPSEKQTLKGTTRPGWFTPVAVVLVLGGAAGAFAGVDALSKAMPDTTVGYGGIAAVVVALVAVAVLAATTKREIRVDSKGIELRAGMGQPVRIKWSEPHEYYYLAVSGASTPTVEKASVRTSDGRRIDVGDIEIPNHPNARVPGLVEKYSTAANWPKIRELLEENEDVDFGVVRLNGERILLGDLEKPVEDGVVLQIDKGLLRLGCKGKWTSTKVSVKEVANYPCLLRAVGQISQALPPS